MTELKRLTKLLSEAGICSRREAEKYIAAGRLSFQKQIITEPGFKCTDLSNIQLDNNPISKINNEPAIWLFHKTKNIICSHNDKFHEDLISNYFPKQHPHLLTIGRLDINSEGLILFTNNSSIKEYFEKPKNNISRVYQVRAFGRKDPKHIITACQKPQFIEGTHYRPAQVKLIDNAHKNKIFEVILTEGKNREIRKIFAHHHYQVNRLIRVAYGQFKLADLKPCELLKVPSKITQQIYQDIKCLK